MKQLRLWLAVALVGALLSACGGSSSGSSGADDGTLTIAAALDINSFDPADGLDGHIPQYLQPVYDTLVRIDPEGEPQPMLATEWRYVDRQRTVLRLKLREGITFTDGSEFDAEAVKANLLNVKNGTGALATSLMLVDDIVVRGDHEVDIRLLAPDPQLLRTLGQPPGMMASPLALGDPMLKSVPVGSGPYVLDVDETTKGSQYTYVRNEDYWDPELVHFDKIVIKPILDPAPRLNALESGQADVGMGEPKIVDQAKSAGLDVTEWYTGDLAALYIFDRDGSIVPALADPRVRQALNYAIDADALVTNVLRGYGTPTRQVFIPESAGFDGSLDDSYPYDPDKARQLLAEAGYADGFDLPLPQLPITAELGAVIAQQLEDVGVRVQWQNVAMSSALSDVTAGKFPAMVMYFQSGDPWQAINFYIAPQAPFNPLHSTDPEVDRLIQLAQASTGEDQAATYRELNAWLVENAWFAPWASPKQVYLSNDTVTVTPQAFAPVPSIYNYAPAGS